MTALVFLIITLLATLLFYYGTGKDRRFLLAICIWSIITGTIARAGFFKARPMSFIPFIILSVILTVICFRKVKPSDISLNLLLSVHLLRIAVEWVLYELFLQGKIPELMTFKGWNFDIIMGISAGMLLVYRRITKQTINRVLFIIWNITGLLFLTFIVLLAILSSPLPVQQFAFEQPNVALLEFPYCFLPTIIVLMVYLSHFLMLKASMK